MTNLQKFAAQRLTKNQMNNIKGGGMSGTCAFMIPNGDNEPFVMEGVSKEVALSSINGHPGARWCCDSCSGASWL